MKALRLLTICAFFAGAVPVWATTVIPASDPGEEALASDAVFFVKAGSSRALVRPGFLATVTKAEVLSVVSGPAAAGDPVEIWAPGGAADGRGWMVQGSPRFTEGQTYLVFAGLGGDGRWRPRLLADSVLMRQVDSNGAAVLVPVEESRDLKRLGVADPDVGLIPAPVDETLFVDRLRRSLAGEPGWDWQQMLAPSASAWSQLKAAPAGCAFMTYEGTRIRWETFDNGLPLEISADSTGDQSIEGGGFEEVSNALDRWMAIGGTSLDLEYGGPEDYTLTCAEGDDSSNPEAGDHIVVFNDPCGDMDDLENCGGTLAFGGPWFGPQHTFDGETWYTAGSWFVVINNDVGSCIDRRTYELVVTHELGHGLGFGHTEDPSSLMFSNCCSEHNQLDITCARYLYPSDANVVDGVTVPVIASISGVDGVPWRSEMTIANPTDRSTVIELTYQPVGADPISVSRTLPGSSTLFFEDAAALFSSGEGRGTLRLVSSDSGGQDPVVVTRAVAEQSFGRFGSGLPSDEQPGADTVAMPGLINDMDFRSNISVTAGTGADVGVTFELFRSDQGLVESGVARTVAAGAQEQWRVSDLFPGEGYSALPMTVRATMDQPGLAHASIIDNASTDSAVVLGRRPSRTWTVPVAAHVRGEDGTFWTSDVSMWNASGAPVTVVFEYLAEGVDNSGGGLYSEPIQLDAFATTTIEDVLFALFGIGDGTGSLAIESSGSITVMSRVSTAGPNGGSTGNGVRTATLNDWSINRTVLPGVRMAGDQRTNIGFVTGDSAMTFACKLLKGNGAIAAEGTVEVAARSMRHLSVEEVFGSSGYTPPDPVGTIVVESSGSFLAYLTVIDGTSQDPIFVMPR